MSDEPTEEVQANLDRADESVRAAQTLLASGHADFAASRAYYAAFYAATAMLLSEGVEFRRHSGVIAAIHKRFVRSGRLDQTLGRDLNWLFELRSVGDYGETRHVPIDDAQAAIEAADRFVGAVKGLLGV